MYSSIKEEKFTVCLSEEILDLVALEYNNGLLSETVKIRQKLTEELGYVIPHIHFHNSDDLNQNEFSIKIHDIDTFRGLAFPGYVAFYKDELKGYKVEENDIIAIDDGYTTVIDYDESIDKKVSSIFQIIRDKSADSMVIEKKAKKIVISLPDEEFTYYDNLRRNDNFQNIFFSMIAIPALTYCLKEFQDAIRTRDYDLDSIEMEYNWFISVKKAYKNQFNVELNEEILKNTNVSVVAQKLLNNGNLKGIKDLFDISIGRKIYGGEDDE
jgi:hypothetical protein